MSKRISKFITIMLVAAMMLSCFSTYNASTNVYAAKRTTATKNIKQNNKKNKDSISREIDIKIKTSK